MIFSLRPDIPSLETTDNQGNQANINFPLGFGISRPNDFAVSIHS